MDLWLPRPARIGRRAFLGGAAATALAGLAASCDSGPPDAAPTSPGDGSTADRTSRPVRTVAVLGGGVGGMTAAQELAERGFEVTVYERQSICGGKARSMGVPDTGAGGRPDLPGEHGFRFFPSFYRNVPDTMSRIPYGANPNGVLDNLVTAPLTLFSRAGLPDIEVPLVSFDLPAAEVQALMVDVLSSVFGVEREEAAYFTNRIAEYLTSCEDRRLAEHEMMSWWDYVGAERFSEAYQKLLAIGATRNTVAAKAEHASARTISLVLGQFYTQMAAGRDDHDRLLNGPTNEVWLDPWLDHLRSLGVDYRFDITVQELVMRDGELAGVGVSTPGGTELIEADAYVAAVPVEVASELFGPGVLTAAPELAGVSSLTTEWMNGVQFFLTESLPIVDGHVNYLDSPWALTSVSQAQFWPRPVTDYGDGSVRDVLSIDVSDWESPGIVYGKGARDCSPDEVIVEVLAQIRDHLDDPDQLADEIIERWFIDPSLTFGPDGVEHNAEPLLVNTAGSVQHRPPARTSIPNLVLAADYVRTEIDLATMESANEAARVAVNALLDLAGTSEQPCEVFGLEEPPELEPLRRDDQARFDRGEPNLIAQLYPR